MKNTLVILTVLTTFALSAGAADNELLFYSKFDSAADITVPTFGPVGQAHDATFVPGKVGQALYVPPHKNVAEFAYEKGFPEACTIDFWAKIDSPRERFLPGADPYLFMIANGYEGVSSIVFEVHFNANNGCGQCGLFCGMTYARSLNINRGTKFADYLGADPKGWHRYTVRWNCSGLDGTSNIMQLMVDGKVLGTGMNNPEIVEKFKRSLKQPLKLIFSNLDNGHGNSAILVDEVKVYSTDRHIETVIGRSANGKKKPRVVALKDSAETIRQRQLAAKQAKVAASLKSKGSRIAAVPDWAAGTYVGGGEDGAALFIVDKSGILVGRWTTAKKVWKMKAEYFGTYDATNKVCTAEVVFEADGEKMKKVFEVTPTSAKTDDFEAWACEWDVNPAWRAVADKLSGKMAEFEEEGTTVHLEIGCAGQVRVMLSRSGVVRTSEAMLVPVEGKATEYAVYIAVPADSKGFDGFVGEFILDGNAL